jgi:hypothetical protein
LNEDLLGQVFGFGPVAKHSEDKRRHTTPVGLNELVERTLVTRHEALDQLRFELVGERHVRPWWTTIGRKCKVEQVVTRVRPPANEPIHLSLGPDTAAPGKVPPTGYPWIMSAGGGVVGVVCALVALLGRDCIEDAPPASGPPPPLSLPPTYPCSPLASPPPDQVLADASTLATPKVVLDATTADGHRLLVLRPAVHGPGAVSVFYGTPTSMIERPLVNPFAASTTDAAFLVDGVEADVYFAGAAPTLLIGDERIVLSVVLDDGGTLASDQSFICVN